MVLRQHIPDNPFWLENDALKEAVRVAIYGAYQKGEHRVYEPYLKNPVWKEADLSLLTTSGTVNHHTDSEELPRISYHAVLHNDGFLVKGWKQSRKELEPQIPGTIIALDILQEHQVVKDQRCYNDRAEYPGFASLVFGSVREVPWNVVYQRLKERLQKIYQG